MTSSWAPVAGHIFTAWTAEVDPLAPLPEYPRPQLVRPEWLNLNGLWDYSIRPRTETSLSFAEEGQILVPFVIESALSGVKKPLLPTQRLWYRRSFTVPRAWAGSRVILHFGAVDFDASGYVNGTLVGMHEGGSTPFSFDVTDQLRDGDNELVVAVHDGTDRERGKQALDPRGLTYTAASGIWQTVWLEPVPEARIESVNVVPTFFNSTFTIEVATKGATPTHMVEVEVRGGPEVISATAANGSAVVLTIPNARPWSPEDPFLYDMTIRLVDEEQTIDTVESYAGMRSFTLERDAAGIRRFALNGEPYFQVGILDQGYWPDGLYTAPTDEALAYDIEVTKSLGFNMTRKHIKVEPARWYHHCDRLGLIVWQDMPSGGAFASRRFYATIDLLVKLRILTKARWNRLTRTRFWAIPENARRAGRSNKRQRASFETQLREMILALRAFPSIAGWVPFNEGWGQYDSARIAREVAALDPTRYVDHASGWRDQLVGDIVSFHDYEASPNLPDERRLGLDRVLALTEFGGLSLVEKGHIWGSEDAFVYHQMVARDDFEAGYSNLMNRVRELAEAGLSASVLTQLTDVEVEMNGLVTYDRKVVKIDLELSRRLNEDIIRAGRGR